jgi:hypothetical protein
MSLLREHRYAHSEFAREFIARRFMLLLAVDEGFDGGAGLHASGNF